MTTKEMAKLNRRLTMIKPLINPIRMEIARQMLNPAEPVSAVMVHRRMSIPLSNISYHVKVLKGAGLLTPRAEIPRRGAIERTYVLNAHGIQAMALVDQLAAA